MLLIVEYILILWGCQIFAMTDWYWLLSFCGLFCVCGYFIVLLFFGGSSSACPVTRQPSPWNAGNRGTNFCHTVEPPV